MCWIIFGVSCAIVRDYGLLGYFIVAALMLAWVYVYIAYSLKQAPLRAHSVRRFRE